MASSLGKVMDKCELSKHLFVVAVVMIALVPCMPIDPPWTLGGNLSKSFRRSLLALAATYFVHQFLIITMHVPDAVSLILDAMEGIGISFLSLLTPYILRCYLAERINIPGGRQHGKGLMPWVYTFIALSLTGVVTRAITSNPHMWVFKKIADTLSFIPVKRTLQWYNLATTGHVRYPGRGSILSQVVLTAEYCALVTNATHVIMRLLILAGIVTHSEMIGSLIDNNLYANYVRVMCHSILINVLDETQHYYHIDPQHSSAGAGGGGTTTSSSKDNPTSSTSSTTVISNRAINSSSGGSNIMVSDKVLIADEDDGHDSLLQRVVD